MFVVKVNGWLGHPPDPPRPSRAKLAQLRVAKRVRMVDEAAWRRQVVLVLRRTPLPEELCAHITSFVPASQYL